MAKRELKSYEGYKHPITVNQLLQLVEEQVKKGNGDKYVFLGTDDEGNNYRPLFYGFMADEEKDDYLDYTYNLESIEYEEDVEHIAVLG